MTEETLAITLIISEITVICFTGMLWTLLWSEAKSRGWEDGCRANELYHRHTVDVLKGRIEAREYALSMYRDISTTLCDNISDCMYCPYECDKNNHRCALWDLNKQVERFGIKEVHVDTRHDGGDGHE